MPLSAKADDPYVADQLMIMNMYEAVKVQCRILSWGLDIYPVCPQLSLVTDLAAKSHGMTIPYDLWIKMDLQEIDTCDAVLVLDPEGKSKGCKIEKEYAESKGIPVYESVSVLRRIVMNKNAINTNKELGEK